MNLLSLGWNNKFEAGQSAASTLVGNIKHSLMQNRTPKGITITARKECHRLSISAHVKFIAIADILIKPSRITIARRVTVVTF